MCVQSTQRKQLHALRLQAIQRLPTRILGSILHGFDYQPFTMQLCYYTANDRIAMLIIRPLSRTSSYSASTQSTGYTSSVRARSLNDDTCSLIP